MKFLPIHWTDTSIAFKAVDLCHIIVSQFKVKDIEVSGNAIFGNRLWNNDVATLNLIANQNLCWRFVVFLRNSKNLATTTEKKRIFIFYNIDH